MWAVGIAVLAVLGDGYYEITKHVWLPGYLLDVTGLALLGAILVVLSRIFGTHNGQRGFRAASLIASTTNW